VSPVLSSLAVEVALVVALTAALGVPAVPSSPGSPPPGSSTAAAADEAVALTRRIQERHRKVLDMKARFIQTYASGLLGRTVVERGTLAIKRPDRMLWEYQKPEKKTFVSNGRRSYFYVPADRQVIVREASADQGVALHLLSGRSDLLAEFQVFAVPGSGDRVRLLPRAANAEVQEVLVDADAAGQIRRLEVLDLQGNRSIFVFEDVKENVGLRDSLFEFKIPSGVEVVAG
jgi:outer membrane lipoprotein carrier protein